MQRFLDSKFKAEKNDYDFFIKHGCRFKSIDGEKAYIYTFPLEKWKNFTVLEGKITIYETDGEVMIDVLTQQGHFYEPFYNPIDDEYDEYMNKIYKRIEDTLSYLKIKKLNKRGRKKN